MRARPIPDLDPQQPTRLQVASLLGTRVDELFGHAAAALDIDNVVALHDMRIAGKRLRYGLESLACCLASDLPGVFGLLVVVQDRLGEIHDLDVGVELVRSEMVKALRRLRRQVKLLDEHAASLGARASVEQLEHAMREGSACGLVQLLRLLQERRAARHAEFVLLWSDMVAAGLRARIEALWRGGQ